MALELLRNHELDGVIQHCITWNCSCGAVRVIPFLKFKNREKTTCPQCGACSSFHSGIIEKIENELNSDQ